MDSRERERDLDLDLDRLRLRVRDFDLYPRFLFSPPPLPPLSLGGVLSLLVLPSSTLFLSGLDSLEENGSGLAVGERSRSPDSISSA